jgi:uncharacterized membrane protein
LKGFTEILSFIGVQYLFGKRGSFPFGLILKFGLIKISFLVILSDMILSIFLLNLLPHSIKKIKNLRLVKRFLWREKNKSENLFRKYLKKFGKSGLLIISALPYGGGALTGTIVATSIKMDKFKAFILITIGCIIGTTIFYMIFSGIFIILKVL